MRNTEMRGRVRQGLKILKKRWDIKSEFVSLYLKRFVSAVCSNFPPLPLTQLCQVSPKFAAMLLEAIIKIREVFDKHAGKDGDSLTLSKKEASDLFKEEMGLDGDLNGEMKKLFEILDGDSSGTISFPEFASFVASIAILIK